MSQTGKTGRLCGLLACWILAAACGGAAGSAAGSRSSETAASQAASIEWEQTVAAARREGKIAIVGPQGSDIPADHVLPVYVLKDGVPYMDEYSDSYAPKAAEVTAFMETVLRR